MRCPARRASIRAGATSKVGRHNTDTDSMHLPSTVVSSPRRNVSTSGSSGIGSGAPVHRAAGSGQRAAGHYRSRVADRNTSRSRRRAVGGNGLGGIALVLPLQGGRSRARRNEMPSEQNPILRCLRQIRPRSDPSAATTAKRRSPRSISRPCTAVAGVSGHMVRPASVDHDRAGATVPVGGRSVRVKVPTSLLPSVRSTMCTWSLLKAARACVIDARAGRVFGC